MPGDPFKSVAPGQKLEIPAAAYNAFLDAARFARGQQHTTEREANTTFRPTGIVKLRNNTGRDLNRFDVVQIGAPLILPADNQTEFDSRNAFTAIVPQSQLDRTVAILQEPIAISQMGNALIAGVTSATLEITDEAMWRARATPNEVFLTTHDTGPIHVLWKEPGLGRKQAKVLLVSDDRGAIVRLLQPDGKPGQIVEGFVQRWDESGQLVDRERVLVQLL